MMGEVLWTVGELKSRTLVLLRPSSWTGKNIEIFRLSVTYKGWSWLETADLADHSFRCLVVSGTVEERSTEFEL
jgi:hypothetical protein